ncbi:MAG: hypothetical protein RLZZ342_446 [Candidatus Parcubacteria bacterium]
MNISTKQSVVFALGVLGCVSVFSTPVVQAAEVVWNAAPYERLGHPATIGTWGLSGVQVRVSYHAKVVRTDTGVVIPCGGSVSAGTPLRFSFEPHTYNDVYWVGSGYNADSPYGDWVAGSALPAGNICVSKNLVSGPQKHTSQYYGTLSVAPPAKTIAGLPSGCTTAADGVSKACTPTDTGTISAAFKFAPTTGKFYGTGGIFGGSDADKRGGPLYCSNAPQLTLQKKNLSTSCVIEDGRCPVSWFGGYRAGSQTTCREWIDRNPNAHYWMAWQTSYRHETCTTSYTYANLNVEVPAQSISCPITITPAATGGAPTTPNLAAGAAACVVGTPYSFTMTSNDPDGDRVRYGIDWTADGTIDQFVPPSGYMTSGQSTTTRRTFSTAGNKTVRVLAQDEKGMMSGWSSLSFNCTAADITTAQTITSEDDTLGGGFTDDGGAGFGIGTGGGTGVTLADLVLRAVPSLIRRGETTKVTWSAANVASCTVTGENGDSWTGLVSPVGGRISRPITQRTTFTLTCLGGGNTLVKTAVVNVLPNWEEQ